MNIQILVVCIKVLQHITGFLYKNCILSSSTHIIHKSQQETLKIHTYFNSYLNKSSASFLPAINITFGKLAAEIFGNQEILMSAKFTFS